MQLICFAMTVVCHFMMCKFTHTSVETGPIKKEKKNHWNRWESILSALDKLGSFYFDNSQCGWHISALAALAKKTSYFVALCEYKRWTASWLEGFAEIDFAYANYYGNILVWNCFSGAMVSLKANVVAICSLN